MIGSLQLLEETIQTRLNLRQAALHLGPREVPVAVIDGLELAAVDNHQRLGKEVQTTAQDNKLTTHAANRLFVVLAKVGYCLVVRHQTTGEPHQFHVAGPLAQDDGWTVPG